MQEDLASYRKNLRAYFGRKTSRFISSCPRCGFCTLENLVTHSHCLECTYSPEYDSEIGLWRRIEFPHSKRRQNFLNERGDGAFKLRERDL